MMPADAGFTLRVFMQSGDVIEIDINGIGVPGNSIVVQGTA